MIILSKNETSILDDQYELSSSEIDKGTLKVSITSKMGYLAWEELTVYFYKYSDGDV